MHWKREGAKRAPFLRGALQSSVLRNLSSKHSVARTKPSRSDVASPPGLTPMRPKVLRDEGYYAVTGRSTEATAAGLRSPGSR